MEQNEIEINKQIYVLKTTIKNTPRESITNKKFVMIRSRDSGVWAGYLKSHKTQEVVLLDARRIYYWDGAATLSELAMRGTSKPENCKFPVAVDEVLVIGVCEIIPITAKAKASIDGVKVWSM
jgi:hypothetical protein